MKEILDSTKHGAIYFSFGSNVKTSDLPPSKIRLFMEVFKELPYTVLWKYDTEHLPKKPANVHVFKWLPQQDVLGTVFHFLILIFDNLLFFI